jgi:hypothetical protein
MKEPTPIDPDAQRGGGDSPPRPRPAGPGPATAEKNYNELVIDKVVDFFLIFVGLYAATAVQRWQDADAEKGEYVALLQDFKTELATNLAQEQSIATDLGAIEQVEPGKNLGPMAATFDEFFTALAEDEKAAHCLHVEYATDGPGLRTKRDPKFIADCHALYAEFDAEHSDSTETFAFRPAVLTPFYHYEVWQLYLANGVRVFRNKDLAVRIGEVYSNAKLVEQQIADIEATYNDTFMVQVAKGAATDSELAQIIHDEEQVRGLSPQNQQSLIHITHAVKEERYAAKEARSVIELKVERMKKTVLRIREEIAQVQAAIDEELARVGD